jgi:hypothetical protein
MRSFVIRYITTSYLARRHKYHSNSLNNYDFVTHWAHRNNMKMVSEILFIYRLTTSIVNGRNSERLNLDCRLVISVIDRLCGVP